MTRCDRVLKLLKDRRWHSTMEIQSVHIGGAAGTSRIRELRRRYRIKAKPARNLNGRKTTQWLYKLEGKAA